MSAPNSNHGLTGLQIFFLVLAGFFALIALAVGFVFSKPPADDGEAETRIEAVAKLDAVVGSGNVGSRSGEEIYNATCANCHGSGAMGAPKTGDKGAWASRLGGNVKSLVASAVK